MARSTPEETFAEARAAMERGDWEGVFACLDAGDLRRMGEDIVGRFLADGDDAMAVFVILCLNHGVPDDARAEVRSAVSGVAESIGATIASDTAAMVQQLRQHRQNLAAYRLAVKDMLKGTPNLPAFLAALERGLGGESVPARPFVDEVVENVHIDGTKAQAIRRGPSGFQEDVGFVRKKGIWFIRLFGRRPT